MEEYTRALAECKDEVEVTSDTLTGAQGVGQSVAQIFHNTDQRAEKLAE